MAPPHRQPEIERDGRASLETVRDADRRFWSRHLWLGAALSTVLGGAVLVYLARTPTGPHRPVLAVLTGTGASLGLVALGVMRRELQHDRYRPGWFFGWSLALIVLILVAANLDGGDASPLTVLLFPVVVYTAMAYPPASVLILSSVVTVGYAVLTATDASAVDVRAGLVGASIASVSLLAVVGATNHAHRIRTDRMVLRRLADDVSIDDLTGCASRRAWNDAVAAEVGRGQRYERPVALLSVDIDLFKRVNDQFGHAVGDEVLRGIGSVLRSSVRATDFVGRPGGDEFGVLMPETDPGTAAKIAERIRASVEAAHLAAPATVSVGVATLRPGDRAVDLAERADAALYAAKSGGRNRVVDTQVIDLRTKLSKSKFTTR